MAGFPALSATLEQLSTMTLKPERVLFGINCWALKQNSLTVLRFWRAMTNAPLDFCKP